MLKKLLKIILIYLQEELEKLLSLNKPIYEITSSYGHFGRKPTNKGEFSWEKTDKTHIF